MSFGFGISDFITVIDLANTIRKDFSAAPKQYQGIAQEVKDFTSILQDIDTFAAGNDVTSQEAEAKLCSIVENCGSILKQIKTTLDKYSSLEDAAQPKTRLRGKARRIWDQVRFEPDDIRDFRLQINSNVGLLNAIIATITRDNIIKLVARQELHENHEILDWLANTDYNAQQLNSISSKVDGTGKWLLESSEYQEWLNSSDSNNILFLNGIPGAGKTLLSSIVVEHLQQKCQDDPASRLCYFYCDFSRGESQQLDNIMLALLRQMAECSTILPSPIKDLYNKHQAHKTRPSLEEIKTVIYAVSEPFDLYLIVDALDECQASNGCQGRLITEILNLRETATARVMVTSRPVPQVLDRFRACKPYLVEMEVIASEHDVRRYIDMHIEELPLFVVESLKLQTDIKDSIVEAVEGMFLLAKLHLESLKGTTTKKSLRGVLRSFRQGRGGYTEAYGKTMERISRQHQGQRDLAIEAITWIVYARRPLKAAELLHALAIEIDEPEFDEENVPDLREVLSICCGLVTKEAETETMRLIHYTTQEFFEGNGLVWVQDIHNKMHRSCIAYLSFDSFSTGISTSGQSLHVRCEQFPFYGYASHHWGSHIPSKEADLPAIQRFLGLSENIQATVQALLETEYDFSSTVWEDKNWTGLHLITYLGLPDLVRQTLHMWDLESRDVQGATALMFAITEGYEAIVKILVDHGAGMDSVDQYRSTPFTLAVNYNRTAICRFLIEKGVQIDSEAGRQTPLGAASERGMLETVQLLLEKGAQPNAVTQPMQETALLLACRQGNRDIAQVLINKGASVDLASAGGITALSAACLSGYDDTVRLLLEHDAKVNTADIWEVTALMVAAAHCTTDTVEHLISRGAQVNIADHWGRTPLMWACMTGQETTARLLSYLGQHVNVSGSGTPPLMYASLNGYDGVLRLRIENGARVDDSDSYGDTVP